jgi:hypothetical protein
VALRAPRRWLYPDAAHCSTVPWWRTSSALTARDGRPRRRVMLHAETPSVLVECALNRCADRRRRRGPRCPQSWMLAPGGRPLTAALRARAVGRAARRRGVPGEDVRTLARCSAAEGSRRHASRRDRRSGGAKPWRRSSATCASPRESRAARFFFRRGAADVRGSAIRGRDLRLSSALAARHRPSGRRSRSRNARGVARGGAQCAPLPRPRASPPRGGGRRSASPLHSVARARRQAHAAAAPTPPRALHPTPPRFGRLRSRAA